MKMRKLRGTVISCDDKTVTLDIYHLNDNGHRRKLPLTVPIPRAMPRAWLVPGADFACHCPQDMMTATGMQDPGVLVKFEPPPLWWWTTEELERYLDGKLTPEEDAAIMARKPEVYSPHEVPD